MHRCLELARQGQGRVGNGAMVGAVLVRDGEIIVEAWHEEFGGPHAERKLLDKFDQKIGSEDILYLSLEPCCHHGKTPPCTDILLQRGIKNIVVGMRDPDSRVAGRAIKILREHGSRVVGPILPELCDRLNKGFVSARAHGRPWVTLKQALTRSGEISNVDGSSQKITSSEQDRWSHSSLRALHDAILVGINTIISDDPILNTRFIQNEGSNKKIDQENAYQPYRIILDPHLRIPLTSRVLTDVHRSRTIIVTSESDSPSAEALRSQGVHIMQIAIENNLFDWDSLWKNLQTPSESFHGITSILIEGGRRTWEAFRNDQMVDEEVILVGR